MNNNTDFTEGFCKGHEKALQHVQKIIKELWDEERRDNTDRAILLTELSHKVDGLRMDEGA